MANTMRAIDYFKCYKSSNSPEVDLVRSICKIKGFKKQKFIENAIHHEIERYKELLTEEQLKEFDKFIE